MIKLYTDGSSNGKTGDVGGWAFLIDDSERRDMFLFGKCGYQENATNNRMELLAVLEGLKECRGEEKVEVLTDSELVVRWMTGRYRINKEEISNLADAIYSVIYNKKLSVSYTHVRGHSTCKGNNFCDERAKMARTQRVNSEGKISVADLETY